MKPPSTHARPPLMTPFFYGWILVGMAMVAGFLGAASSQLFMGIMLKPVSEEMAWSRSVTSGAITAGTLTGGFLSPITGFLVDRYGARLLMPIGAAAVSLAFLGLANLNSLVMFYVAYIAARGLTTMCLGGVVPLTTMANWFYHKRGRAMGLVAMSLPLGGSILALAGQQIMAVGTWRTVFVVFAILMATVVIAPSAFLMRRRPEDVGLLPDGASSSTASDASQDTRGEPARLEYSFTLKEALRTSTLWLLVTSMVLDTMANGAVGFHQVAYYSDIGISPAVAAAAFAR